MKTESQHGDELVIPVPEVSPPGGQKSPEDSRKLIQKQLVLLLHAHACQKKDVGCPIENRFKCPVPNCKMMKDVWLHIKECKIGPDCSHLHCSSSLKILAHWKHCKAWECPVCHIVRMKSVQFKTNLTALSGDSGGSPSNEVSGQSTKPLIQGQSQCQGQLLQQMKPGSELNGSYCYYNCSLRGNTCHVESTQSMLHPSHHPFQYQYQQNQSSLSIPYFQQFQPPEPSLMLINPQKQYLDEFNGIFPGNMVLQNGILPVPTQLGSEVKVNHRSNSNRKQCQCLTCIGPRSDLQHGRYDMMTYPVNTRNIQIPSQMRNRKRSADAYPMEFHMTSRHKANEAPAPSANDVRRAYEQLGIPCPSDALKRLMATLPGGSKVNLGQEGDVLDNQNQSSSEEDDGINVEYDAPSSSWCLSLVERLVSNGHQITAGSS